MFLVHNTQSVGDVVHSVEATEMQQANEQDFEVPFTTGESQRGGDL